MNNSIVAATQPRTLLIETFDGPAGEWNDFVRSQPGSTFCHHLGWRDIIAGALGHRTLPLVVRGHEGEILGALPLARVKSRIFGDYLISMPFLNYGGPVGAPEACYALSLHAQTLAQGWRVKMLELRTRTLTPSPLVPSMRKVTVLLDLPDTPEELWNAFPSKLRSQIRRPMKENMQIRFGVDQREAFYEVFRRNMHALGTPVLPARLFEAISGMFGDEVVFGVVHDGTQPVAAGCGFIWNGEFEITWASSLREANAKSPNMLLYWAFMERMIQEGVSVFNFGRCTPDGGTHRFKLQWGGATMPLPWQAWSRAGAAAPPTQDGGVFELASRMWTRLPEGVASRVGPLLSRNIP